MSKKQIKNINFILNEINNKIATPISNDEKGILDLFLKMHFYNKLFDKNYLKKYIENLENNNWKFIKNFNLSNYISQINKLLVFQTIFSKVIFILEEYWKITFIRILESENLSVNKIIHNNKVKEFRSIINKWNYSKKKNQKLDEIARQKNNYLPIIQYGSFTSFTKILNCLNDKTKIIFLKKINLYNCIPEKIITNDLHKLLHGIFKSITDCRNALAHNQNLSFNHLSKSSAIYKSFYKKHMFFKKELDLKYHNNFLEIANIIILILEKNYELLFYCGFRNWNKTVLDGRDKLLDEIKNELKVIIDYFY